MVNFELNEEGVRELLNSEEMQDILQKEANKVLGRLPKGYGSSSGFTSERAKVTVGTRSKQAAAQNMKENTLLKALGSGE